MDGAANTITYEVINPMGAPGKVKSVKKATIVQINNEKTTDATGKVKVADEGKVTVEFTKKEVADLPWTSHLIMFEFEGASGSSIHINKTFEVKTTIVEEMGVSVSQNDQKSAPDHYQFDKGYPREFNALNTNENPYLHIQI